MTDDRKITMTDIRKAGHCVRGARQWFEGHGIDVKDVVKNGITVERLRALDDGLAEQVIQRTFGDD